MKKKIAKGNNFSQVLAFHFIDFLITTSLLCHLSSKIRLLTRKLKINSIQQQCPQQQEACSSLLTIMHGGSGGERMSNKSFLIFISFEDRMLTQSSIFGHAISVGVLVLVLGKGQGVKYQYRSKTMPLGVIRDTPTNKKDKLAFRNQKVVGQVFVGLLDNQTSINIVFVCSYFREHFLLRIKAKNYFMEQIQQFYIECNHSRREQKSIWFLFLAVSLGEMRKRQFVLHFLSLTPTFVFIMCAVCSLSKNRKYPFSH